MQLPKVKICKLSSNKFIIKQRVLLFIWLTYGEYDGKTDLFKPIYFENQEDAAFIADLASYAAGARTRSYSKKAYNASLLFLISLGVFIYTTFSKII